MNFAEKKTNAVGLKYDAWATICSSLVFVVGGLLLVSLQPSGRDSLALWSGAYLLVGSVVGFLFGIPRVIEAKDTETNGDRLRINTNLEQISDWLTKIIVGLGLIELGHASAYLRKAASLIASTPSGPSLSAAAGVIIYFSIVGLLYGYLYTRLLLSGMFNRADHATQISDVTDKGERRALAAAPLDYDPTKEFVGGAASAASKILKQVSFASLTTAADIGLWAKAKLQDGDAEDAVLGYKRAVELEPNDPRLRLEYAIALNSKDAPRSESITQLMEAKRLMPRTGMLCQNVYKWLTYLWLYEDQPASFQNSIALAEEYLAAAGEVESPSDGLLINLACAYGQKLRWLKAAAKGLAEVPETVEVIQTKEAALKAAKQAISINPEWKKRLRALVDGRESEDDDLVIFKGDPDWDQLLS